MKLRFAPLFMLLPLAGSVPAFAGSAEFERFMSNAPCASEVRASASKLIFEQVWYPLMVSQANKPLVPGIAFRNTMSGHAYQLFSDEQSTTLVETKLNGKLISASVWEKRKGCRAHLSDYKSVRPEISTPAKAQGMAEFTDNDLNELLRSSSWGVIYVWSPYMPLSIEAIKEIKEAMQSRMTAGRLTILLDGKANIDAAKDLAKQGKVDASEIRQVASSELFSRNLSLHYPAAFIYKQGLLSNRKYIGHKFAPVYAKWIDIELKSLNESIAALKKKD